VNSSDSGGSTIGRMLRQFAPVKRTEVLTVLLLAVNCFTLLACYYVLKVVREPLILLGGGAELKSYASAGQTILLLGVVPAFSWLASKVTRIRLMTTMQIIFMGCLVGFYVLSEAKAPIGLAFYLWVGIFNVLVVSNFWSFVNDIYTEEEGKRLFGVIGIGASIGAIAGATLPKLLHKVLGVPGLMALAVGGLGISIVLYHIVERREAAKKEVVAQEKAAKPKDEVKQDKKGGFALVMRDKYLRLLAGMLLTATIINSVGEYVIGNLATKHAEQYARDKVAKAGPAPAPDAAVAPAASPKADSPAKQPADPRLKAAEEEYLKDFFASYYGLVNLVSFLLQTFIVARLLVTLGVRRALFIMPLIVLGGWFALVLFVNVSLVRIEKTTENSLDYSLHNTLRQALFLPTSREAKYKAKAAIDTFFFRMGDVVAGLGLVFLYVEVLHLGVRAFAATNVILGVLWVFLAYRSGRLHDELVAEQHPEDKPAAAA
jgi:AAA family ATP:ADP antiporter